MTDRSDLRREVQIFSFRLMVFYAAVATFFIAQLGWTIGGAIYPGRGAWIGAIACGGGWGITMGRLMLMLRIVLEPERRSRIQERYVRRRNERLAKELAELERGLRD